MNDKEAYRCRACNHIWKKDEIRLSNDWNRLNVPVCADIFCDGTCVKIKKEEENAGSNSSGQ